MLSTRRSESGQRGNRTALGIGLLALAAAVWAVSGDERRLVAQTDPPIDRLREDAYLEPLRAEAFALRLGDRRTFPALALQRAREQAARLPVYWRSHGRSVVNNPRSLPSKPITIEVSGALGGWTPLGPAPLCTDNPFTPDPCDHPYAGRIVSLAPHPVDAQILYAASPGGGVWKTTTGGSIWKPLSDSHASMAVGALALNKADSQVLLASTGSSFAHRTPPYANSSYLGLGMFRTANGGTTWTKVGGSDFTRCDVDRIVFAAAYPKVALAAALADGSGTGPCEGGVYVSVDSGVTWSRWLAKSRASDVLVVGNKVFAGVWGEGVYMSHLLLQNGGQVVVDPTWTQVSGGLPTSEVSRIRMAAAPSDPNRLYVAMGVAESTGTISLKGLWSSPDGGANWVAWAAPPDTTQFMNLSVDPKQPLTVYLGATHLWRSVSGAAFVNLTSTYPIHPDMRDLQWDAAGRLLVGNDGGVARTPDGVTFTHLNGNLSVSQVQAISGTLAPVALLTPSALLMGAQDTGSGRYVAGTKWREVGRGGDGGPSAVNLKSPDFLYTSAQQLSLAKSDDGGGTSKNVGDPSWPFTARAFIAPFVMDFVHPNRLLAGTSSVWQSEDHAETWQDLGPTEGSVLTAIATAPSDAQVIYAGSAAGKVRVTLGGGLIWSPSALNGLPGSIVNDLVVHDATASEAWAVVGGFGHGHVFHTADAGGSWQDVSGNLPDAPANGIAIDATVNPPQIFVATDVGVMVSFDSGVSWNTVSSGLPNTIATDVLLDRKTNSLLAATYGRGVWLTKLK